ncbi:MAG: hypothetical protein AAGL11_04710 [Pseudomonadota bacterium]
MRRTAFASFSLLALSHISCAQTPPPAPATPATPPPPCQEEAYKQFDFWLGDWSVSTPDGTYAGTNKITSEEGGCLVLERWTSASGGTGQSYNFYNPATEKWRQLWVGFGVLIDYEGGLTESGSMKLAGTITDVSTSQTADFTGEWTPNEDGSVTQHFEQYDAETDTWNAWFTGRYTRILPQLAGDD